MHGTSRAYLLDRLRREGRTDLATAVEDGRVSAYAVAIELGWVTRQPTLGTGSTNQAKRREHQLNALLREPLADRELNDSELQELWLGPGHNGSVFKTREELQAAWTRGCDRVLAFRTPGRRPQAWWEFEAPFPYPGFDREPAVLYESELLGEEERAELEREWRSQFERAYGPHFFYCGAGRILNGAAARRMHFRWMGAPRALLARWVKERRRQAKTIRKLVETVAVEPPAA